jgi:hypothetical protein
MSAFKKGRASITPDTDTPTLTVVAVKSTMCGGSPDKHEGGIACNSLDGDRGASLPQASSILDPVPGREKSSIKGTYEVQEIVQEARTRRPLRCLRTNLRHQNPTGYPAESRARRTPTRRTRSHAGPPGYGGAPRCISVHLGKKSA